MKNDFPSKWNFRTSRIAIFLSDKIDFKKYETKYHYIIKGRIHEEDLVSANM
jgi:hypothetical protein